MTRLPNIIFIMADDMGYGDVGCYGATKIRTPNMDRLAAEGMRFTDAHSSSAVCTPSRYSVLTGRYCWRTSRKRGVGGGFSLPLIDPARLTVASMLKRHGYATAAVGKWHVGLEWQAKDGETIDPENWVDEGHVDYSKPIIGGPTRVGFDYFFGIAGSLDMPPYCFIENDRTVGIPSLEKHPYNPQQKKGLMVPGWRDEDVDVHHAEKAVAWLEAHHRAHPGQPFFLYLTPSAPHRPCMPPDFMKGTSEAGPRGDMVQMVDWVVGRVLDALDRLGCAEQTLIFVTSDNGAQPYDVDEVLQGHKSCGDLRGYKSCIWEGGHRVVFIARWPGRVGPGATCGATVGLFDLAATCAEIVGERLPETVAEDSASILPLLCGTGHERPARRNIVHHSLHGMFALRQGQWKCIDGHGGGGYGINELVHDQQDDFPGQLYDLEADLAETRNLWSERPKVVEELRRTLQRQKESGHTRDARAG